MADRKYWMQAAFAKNKGAFSAYAKKTGRSVAEAAKEEYNAKGTLGKRARAAAIGARIARNRAKAGFRKGKA